MTQEKLKYVSCDLGNAKKLSCDTGKVKTQELQKISRDTGNCQLCFHLFYMEKYEIKWHK